MTWNNINQTIAEHVTLLSLLTFENRVKEH